MQHGVLGRIRKYKKSEVKNYRYLNELWTLVNNEVSASAHQT